MMHYAIERDAADISVRLKWTPEIQSIIAQQIQEEDARRRAEQQQRRQSDSWIENWLKTRAPKS